jgi:hypothetical protein
MRERILGVRNWFLVFVAVIAAGMLGNGEALAQQRRLDERRIDRAGIARDSIRRQQVKRAYVAGAVAQHRHERIRDHYEDRMRRERYYDRDYRNDNAAANLLVGAAIGAVVTGAIMSNNKDRENR